MDMSYATIHVFGGNKRLYNEKRLAYVVSSQENPDNHHIHAVDTDLGSSIFFNDAVPHDLEAALQKKYEEQEKSKENKEKEVLEQQALEAK